MANSDQIRLFNQAEGIDQTIEVPAAKYILETAEEQGMEVPFSCRNDVCSTCTVKTISGTVDRFEGSYLSEARITQGYVLSCISHPRSNCLFETHKEQEVLN